MHTEIEKLIIHAREKGFMTPRQRSLIISKAEQLGDDISEIEFLLEDIPIGERDNSQSIVEAPIQGPLVLRANQDEKKSKENNRDDSSEYEYKPISKKKGCRKGCLWGVIIMFALGLIGYLYDLIF